MLERKQNYPSKKELVLAALVVGAVVVGVDKGLTRLDHWLIKKNNKTSRQSTSAAPKIDPVKISSFIAELHEMTQSLEGIEPKLKPREVIKSQIPALPLADRTPKLPRPIIDGDEFTRRQTERVRDALWYGTSELIQSDLNKLKTETGKSEIIDPVNPAAPVYEERVPQEVVTLDQARGRNRWLSRIGKGAIVAGALGVGSMVVGSATGFFSKISPRADAATPKEIVTPTEAKPYEVIILNEPKDTRALAKDLVLKVDQPLRESFLGFIELNAISNGVSGEEVIQQFNERGYDPNNTIQIKALEQASSLNPQVSSMEYDKVEELVISTAQLKGGEDLLIPANTPFKYPTQAAAKNLIDRNLRSLKS